jgi:hypothetical protein
MEKPHGQEESGEKGGEESRKAIEEEAGEEGRETEQPATHRHHRPQVTWAGQPAKPLWPGGLLPGHGSPHPAEVGRSEIERLAAVETGPPGQRPLIHQHA